MAVMPPLKDKPTLGELQAWVAEMKAVNGWTPVDFRHEAFLLMEEVGELCKAYRKTHKTAYLTESQRAEMDDDDVGAEMADVLLFLLSLANLQNIDMEEAFVKKMNLNSKRAWVQNG